MPIIKSVRRTDEGTSSTSDATHVYVGYRRQALYALWRILVSRDTDLDTIFQPEGEEDLAIYNGEGQLVEVVQVKGLGNNLTLASFSPEKPNSFFYRVARRLEANPDLAITVASFGEIGPELTEAVGVDGRKREEVAKKLSGHRLVSKSDAAHMLAKIQLIQVNEADLHEQLWTTLKERVADDADSTLKILIAWMMQWSEQKTPITQQDVLQTVSQLGQYIGQAASHHREWGTTIVLIEPEATLDEVTLDKLSDEFYRGVSARYSHIVAGLDLPRLEKMTEIAEKFISSNVVILHGASGQGKSTLAYRYLHDFFPDLTRFQIRAIENRQHALSIAAAIAHRAQPIGIPIAIFVDAAASDTGWPELVKELAIHSNLHVLVTIREEDFRRANISEADIRFETVELKFEAEEARGIYQALVKKKASDTFLDFDDAWRRFGGEGPLMEFVHLVTQGGTLRERLGQQIKRLQDEVLAGKLPENMLVLLRLIAVASSSGARLEARPLAEAIELAAPDRIFELLEKEYFIRRSDDGLLLQALHPIRSREVARILTTDFSPWIESAMRCLPFIYEPDTEIFLLDAFLHHPTDREVLKQFLSGYQPRRWVGIAGTARALLWLGVKEYVEENEALFQEAWEQAGDGWMYLIDFDVAGAMPGLSDQTLELLEIMRASDDLKLHRNVMLSRQTDKQRIFAQASTWLSGRTEKPVAPVSDQDWRGMGEALFWLGRLAINWPLVNWLSEVDYHAAIETLPLSIMSDVVLGLSLGFNESFQSWLETTRQRIMGRFMQETKTVVVEDDGQKLGIHFIVDYEVSGDRQLDEKPPPTDAKDLLHKGAIHRIELLMKLRPDRQVFACQGYGHKVPGVELPFDSTYKEGVDRSRFPISWLVWINSTFLGISRQPYRPATWPQYMEAVLALRQSIFRFIKEHERKLEIYFRKQGLTRLDRLINVDERRALLNRLSQTILLPQCALDDWGFIAESLSNPADQNVKHLQLVGLAVQRYQPFLTAFRNYTASVTNFLRQSEHALVLNPTLGRRVQNGSQRADVMRRAGELGIDAKFISLSVSNLADAVKMLPSMQRAFRLLLLSFVDEKQLSRLEHLEQEGFNRIWSMWYFFAFYPEIIQPNAAAAFPARVASLLRQMRKHLRRELSDISTDALRFDLLSKDVLWEHEPNLCITVDSESAVAAYLESIEKLVAGIREAFANIKDLRLRNYVMDFYWPSVIAIPLVHGGMLVETAWHLSSYIFRNEDEIKTWQVLFHPIPGDAALALNQAGITLFAHPYLETARRLHLAVAKLAALLTHLADLANLLIIGSDHSLLQQYIDQMDNFIAEGFHSVAASMSEVEKLLEHPPFVHDPEPNLSVMAQAFGELHQAVPLLYESDGELKTRLETFGNLSEQLVEAQKYAFIFYLLWATELLSTQ